MEPNTAFLIYMVIVCLSLVVSWKCHFIRYDCLVVTVFIVLWPMTYPGAIFCLSVCGVMIGINIAIKKTIRKLALNWWKNEHKEVNHSAAMPGSGGSNRPTNG